MKKKVKILLFLGGFIMVIAIFCVAVLWIVYQRPRNSALRDWLVATIPFPVAIVNNKPISLRDYEFSVASAQYFIDKQEQLGLGLNQLPTLVEIRQNELDQFIKLALKENMAADAGMTVTNADVNAYFESEILPQAAGGAAEVTQTLQDLYNWSIDDFKKFILYDVVLTQKLDAQLLADPAVEADIKARSQALYEEISSSEKPFSEFAQENSDDEVSAADGGMLGFFGRGDMVPEFETAAYSLEIGQVSAPIRSPYGYHIIKVTNKDTTADTVEARHILLAFPTTAKKIEAAMPTAKIKKFIPKY